MLLFEFDQAPVCNFADRVLKKYKKIAFYISIAILALIFFSPMINPYLFGFGYADTFQKVSIKNNTLYGIDYIYSGFSADWGNPWGGVEVHPRIHAIDLANGKRIFRIKAAMQNIEVVPPKYLTYFEGKTNIAKVNKRPEPTLQVFPKLKKAIILGYETTENKHFILTCINFSGKKQWQIRQEQVGTEAFKLQYSAKYKDNLILVIGGYVLSIDVKTGKINWKTRA
ncbi:MAG: hypothetical protein ABIH22_04615 [Candidatus Margulisiibacteriota bacterium]